jgi:hypothetical protein
VGKLMLFRHLGFCGTRHAGYYRVVFTHTIAEGPQNLSIEQTQLIAIGGTASEVIPSSPASAA